MSKRSKMKIWKKILLAVLLLLTAFVLYNFNTLKRLSTVISLFDSDKISANFITMEDIFPHTVVKSADMPSSFEHEEFSLPLQFISGDSIMNTEAFIVQSETAGLLVLKNDTILYERYENGHSEEEDYISWSVSKSIISALVGIAVKEGSIESIMDPVDKYAPILKGSGYEGVSVKDVLNMSSGIQFDEDYSDFNSDINKMGRVFALGLSFDKYVSSLKSERPAGEYHKYVSMDTQVLGMVLRGATRETISAFMERELWAKIGAEADAYWLCDNQEVEGVFGGLNARTRDYGRFGLLYANQGYMNGEQIIDTSWVQHSTTATEAHLLPGENPKSSSVFGYGYQWWIPKNTDGVFTANGVYNQYIFVDSVNKIVIVKNSANYHYKTEKPRTIKEHFAFLYSVRDAVLNK